MEGDFERLWWKEKPLNDLVGQMNHKEEAAAPWSERGAADREVDCNHGKKCWSGRANPQNHQEEVPSCGE